MTDSQRLTLRATEIRSRLNEIGGLEGDDYTDAIRAESNTLTTEYREVDTKLRAAIVAEDIPEVRNAVDAEALEYRELVRRADLGLMVSQIVQHRAPDGAGRELQEHHGLAG